MKGKCLIIGCDKSNALNGEVQMVSLPRNKDLQNVGHKHLFT